jgi:hypothetical protein
MRTLRRPFIAQHKIAWAADSHGATVQKMGTNHNGFLDYPARSAQGRLGA